MSERQANAVNMIFRRQQSNLGYGLDPSFANGKPITQPYRLDQTGGNAKDKEEKSSSDMMLLAIGTVAVALFLLAR